MGQGRGLLGRCCRSRMKKKGVPCGLRGGGSPDFAGVGYRVGHLTYLLYRAPRTQGHLEYALYRESWTRGSPRLRVVPAKRDPRLSLRVPMRLKSALRGFMLRVCQESENRFPRFHGRRRRAVAVLLLPLRVGVGHGRNERRGRIARAREKAVESAARLREGLPGVRRPEALQPRTPPEEGMIVLEASVEEAER